MSAIEMRDMTTDQIRAAADFIDSGLRDLPILLNAGIIPVIEVGTSGGPDNLIAFEANENVGVLYDGDEPVGFTWLKED